MYSAVVYLRVRRAMIVEGMSIREASRAFGLHRDTVRNMLAYSVPPSYRSQTRRAVPTLRQAQDELFTGVIDRILDDDQRVPRTQRHTAKHIFERLRDEYGFDGGYTIVVVIQQRYASDIHRHPATLITRNMLLYQVAVGRSITPFAPSRACCGERLSRKLLPSMTIW